MLKSRLESYFDRLWPLNRSLSGSGYRESLDILQEIMPMEVLKTASGSKVFDWDVPQEWEVEAAYFIAPNGKKYADFSKNNLHLLGYSVPFCGKVALEELKKHLHTMESLPHAIPYRTSYYKPQWGFCLSHEEYGDLVDGEYEVVIKSRFYSGSIDVGESYLKGESSQEIFFSSYLCHPSLANNELSGPLVLAFLYEKIKNLPKRRFSYRFVLCPETIGTVCFLKKRGMELKNNLTAGYVLTCLGDKGCFSYKSSRDESHFVNRVAKEVMGRYPGTRWINFLPEGSDERQYSSPGFQLPVGSLMRSSHGSYKEYHTSLDNKDFIDFGKLEESVEMIFKIVKHLEKEDRYINTVRYCEPQLGPRGLYLQHSPHTPDENLTALFWVLNLSDGTNDLEDMTKRSGFSKDVLKPIVQKLKEKGLLI